MTVLPVNKKHLFKIFLAFYFLFFSISPLTYTLADRQMSENEQVIENNTMSLNNSLLLPGSCFVERQSSPDETRHAKGKTDVLVKKKRGLTTENPTEKIFYFATASAPRNNFYNPSALTLHAFSKNILEINKGFNPLLAGNSPPAV